MILQTMTSSLLDPEGAASSSHAQKRLNAPKNDRAWYSAPDRPSHFRDKSFRNSHRQLEVQFSKTSNSVTIPANAQSASLPYANNMLVSMHPDKLRVAMSYGGHQAMQNVFRAMLSSGQFNDVVETHLQQINGSEGSSGSDSLPFQLISSGEEIASVHRREQKERERAGKVRSREDVARDLGDNYFSGDLDESELLV